MTVNPSGIGSPWKYGLSPGIYEEHLKKNIKQDVRMDVAAFIGLAERGPVSCPVVVESWDEYVSCFGQPGDGRLLADTVRLFFLNGGRRCVAVRVLDYENAKSALWNIRSLYQASNHFPVQLQARNPGNWGNRLQIELSFQFEPIIVNLTENDSINNDHERNIKASSRSIVQFTTDADLQAGSLIIFEKQDESGDKVFFQRFIRHLDNIVDKELKIDGDTIAGEDIRLLVLDEGITSEQLTTDRSVQKKGYFQAHHVLMNLSIKLNQEGTITKQEQWNHLAFHPDHPRYLPRIINRKNAAETYVDDSHWNSNDVALLAIEESLIPELDQRAEGSELVRFPLHQKFNILYPDERHFIKSTDEFNSADDIRNIRLGSDAAETTNRDHFFASPKAAILINQQQTGIVHTDIYPFANQPDPLEALTSYDERNEIEPVSLVNIPDLLHPFQFEEPFTLAAKEKVQTTCFGECVQDTGEIQIPVQQYPGLLHGTNLDQLKQAQRRLIEYCELQQDRIAILDLPPGLTAGEIVNWKRFMQSDRAALYTPYLELDQFDINPLVAPPGGAVCGLIANQEIQAGVHIAPANMLVETVEKLHDDRFLPDLGFLHQEKINAIREEPAGMMLMGSRTLSTDSQWTHISVRRLIDYLKRQLVIDTNWAVFEINNHALWNRVYDSVDYRLRPLYERGGFAGTTIQQSYFIRCNADTNPQSSLDQGRLVILVGVAPSVPTEFIVFQLTQESEGLTKVEESHG